MTLEYDFNGFKELGTTTHHVIYRNCTIRSIGSQGIQPVAYDTSSGTVSRGLGVNRWRCALAASRGVGV